MNINNVVAVRQSNIFKTWLIIGVFCALISGAFYLLGYSLNMPFLMYLGLFIGLAQSFVGYFFGDKMALSSVQAKEVFKKDTPELVAMIENLSKKADIPTPKIYISPDQSANAFACGRGPGSASVCFNDGILKLLTKDELKAVAAHEIAHIKNKDILIMTITSVLASLFTFAANMSYYNQDSENRSPLPLILSFLSPFAGLLMQMSISRSREYLADSSAVLYTGEKNGMINALKKLYNNPTPASFFAPSRSHFYIAPPKMDFGQSISGVFSTHPSLESRIKTLEKM